VNPDTESINLTLVGEWVNSIEPQIEPLIDESSALGRVWRRVEMTSSVRTPFPVLDDVIAMLQEIGVDLVFARDVHDELLPTNPSGMAITETSVLNDLRDPQTDEERQAYLDDMAAQFDATGDPEILDQWNTNVLLLPDRDHDSLVLPGAYGSWPDARRGARQHAVDEWERLHVERSQERASGGGPGSGVRIDEIEAQMALYANNLDNFRRNLSPEDQRGYDEWLATVRNDPNISFDIDPAIPSGNDATIDLNIELTYRGIATPTYQNEDLYYETVNDDTPPEVSFLAQAPVTRAGTTVGALITAAGWDVEFSETSNRVINGSGSLAVHETTHWLQDHEPIPRDPSAGFIGRVIHRIDEIELNRILDDARTDRSTDPLGIYLDDRYGKTDREGPVLDRWRTIDDGYNAEPYAVFADMFYSNPDQLHELSPDAYDLMVRTTGVDPLGS